MSLMANHRVRGVSRCQWLYVAVGTPGKPWASVNPRIAQPIGQRSRLGTLAHSDRGGSTRQPRRQLLGGRDWAACGGCLSACSPRLWLVLRQPVWSKRPDHRTNGPPLLIRHRRFVCAMPQPISVGWLAAPSLPYLIQSPRETEDPMGCPCES